MVRLSVSVFILTIVRPKRIASLEAFRTLEGEYSLLTGPLFEFFLDEVNLGGVKRYAEEPDEM